MFKTTFKQQVGSTTTCIVFSPLANMLRAICMTMHPSSSARIFLIILSKTIELDRRMKETTQNLESKLIKAVEINNEDNEYDEDEDITFDGISNVDQTVQTVEQSEFSNERS